MLRRIRVKLRLTPPSFSSIHVRPSSAVAYKVREEEPFGMEYGAGPSRIPYQSPSLRYIQPTSLPSYIQTRSLREKLRSLPGGVYFQKEAFMKRITDFDQATFDLERSLRSLSRLEIHTILHHLIREKKGNLAAALIWEIISLTPRMNRRRLFNTKTIAALFLHRKNFNLESSRSTARRHLPPNITPTLEEQMSPAPGDTLILLVDILESLQDVRFRRTTQMYWVIIRQCLEELQPDLAAKLYVALVEEWVTEGRVAEGANAEDFHPGGGPPREEVLARKQISKMVRRWWIGVRTWKLPGEVLSPHDRLDLWHPRHLSLGEKMRNFPFPLATSPPSIVPQPDQQMLSRILHSLALDPTKSSPAHFASSMRALAILANTVLSRTLPISALGGLLQVFNAAPYKPDVYPDNITTLPKSGDDVWAYTAFTQIHVTLMSLLFSPPISADSLRLAEAHQAQRASMQITNVNIDDDIQEPLPNQSNDLNRVKPISPYMLPPLSFASCRIILYYALKGLRRPAILKSLVKYMKDTFGMGGTNPALYNMFLELGSLIRDNALARQAETILFGPSLEQAGKDQRAYFSSRRISNTHSQTSQADLNIAPLHDTDGPIPSENSLLRLLAHLTHTSQFDRLEKYVYRLIPFLEFSSAMSSKEVESKRKELDLNLDEDVPSKPGERMRPSSDMPSSLTPDVYAAIMFGLEKAGKTGLAQRVFKVALKEESRSIQSFFSARQISDLSGSETVAVNVPNELRLPIGIFTTMLRVWENEYQSFKRAKNHEKFRDRLGWTIPSQYEHLSLDKQVGQMAILTHELVKERYRYHAGRGNVSEEYYEALLRACAGRWGLDDGKLDRAYVDELRSLVTELKEAGMEVPEILGKRVNGDLSGRLTKDPLWKKVQWQKRSNRLDEREEGDEARDAPAALLRRMMGG